MKIRNLCQHYLHPMHIYCRLRDIGFSKKVALNIAKKYERLKKLF